MSLKATLFCFVSNGLITAFKILYKHYTDNIDPSTQVMTINSFRFYTATLLLFTVTTAKVITTLEFLLNKRYSYCRGSVEEFLDVQLCREIL